jgi:hypothetical protein
MGWTTLHKEEFHNIWSSYYKIHVLLESSNQVV